MRSHPWLELSSGFELWKNGLTICITIYSFHKTTPKAYGGLDTEWSSWSNCTECGHTPVKTRVKTCLSPVSKTSGAHCPLIQQIAPCNYPCPGKLSKQLVFVLVALFFAATPWWREPARSEQLSTVASWPSDSIMSLSLYVFYVVWALLNCKSFHLFFSVKGCCLHVNM